MNPASYLRLIFWPLAAALACTVAAVNPFFHPQIPPAACALAWFADLAMVLLLSIHPLTARLGVVIAGVFLAIPCYVVTLPLIRAWLILGMAIPLLIALVPIYSPPTTDFSGRLAFLFSWFGTRKIQRRTPGLDIPSLIRLVLAAVVFGLALAGIGMISPSGFGWPIRWLAGGIMIFSVGEMFAASQGLLTKSMGISAPPFMRSPYLAASISEFWSRRWNVATSQLMFRALCFRPAARGGMVAGLFAAFAASAIVHALLAYAAQGRWGLALVFGAFFLVQPLLILAERAMDVRHWPLPAARIWTLTALAITSPLFVEPMIQVATSTFHAVGTLWLPTLATVCSTLIFNGVVALGQLKLCVKPRMAA